ncbi:MAG: cytochrome P450 [Myxococcota bacterium]
MSRLPPGPRLPRIFQIYRWLRDPVPFLEGYARAYGEAFTLRFPATPPIVIFTNPDAVKEIFTGDPDVLHAGAANVVLEPLMGQNSVLLIDGARHRRERRRMTPPFRGDRMKAYGDVMREVTNRSIDAWPEGEAFPIHRQTQGITLDIILRTVFGLEEGELFKELRESLIEGITLGSNPIYLLPIFHVNLGPLTAWRKISRMMQRSDELLYAEFARRRAEGKTGRSDVLSMLLEARGEDGAPMTDEELRDQMVTLLVAGHETTATALAWVVHRMLANPDVYAKLRRELRDVGGNGPVAVDQMDRLEYLDAVIKETMRLNPIIPFVVRLARKPVRIGGWDIPEGVVVGPCIYLTHRRADVWPDPLAFRPERFLGLRPSPYTFFPFGGGTRLCLGASFATYEMKIVLAELLRRTQLRAAPGHTVRVVRRSITLAPSGGVPVILEGRTG